MNTEAGWLFFYHVCSIMCHNSPSVDSSLAQLALASSENAPDKRRFAEAICRIAEYFIACKGTGGIQDHANVTAAQVCFLAGKCYVFKLPSPPPVDVMYNVFLQVLSTDNLVSF